MESSMKKKCLLIGGAGFIGKKLTMHLLSGGYDVTVLDRNCSSFTAEELEQVRYAEGDYFAQNYNYSILKEQDIVILLACSVTPKSSMETPLKCYEGDVSSMICLLQQMREYDVKQLVLISSGGTIYGNNGADSLKEEMQTYPLNHYGILKLTQEKILMMYNKLYNMENVAFRVANPYGEGQMVSSGVGAVTAFLSNILSDKEICIYGDGTIIRDYIHIDDVAEIIKRYLDMSVKENEMPVYNIGTGKGCSMNELIKIIEEITGKTAKVNYCGKREIDVQCNILDSSKVCKAIGGYQCLSLYEGISQYHKQILKLEKKN